MNNAKQALLLVRAHVFMLIRTAIIKGMFEVTGFQKEKNKDGGNVPYSLLVVTDQYCYCSLKKMENFDHLFPHLFVTGYNQMVQNLSTEIEYSVVALFEVQSEAKQPRCQDFAIPVHHCFLCIHTFFLQMKMRA